MIRRRFMDGGSIVGGSAASKTMEAEAVVSGFTPRVLIGVMVITAIIVWIGLCIWVWAGQCGSVHDVGDKLICVADYAFQKLFQAIGSFFEMIGKFFMKIFHL